MGDENKKVSHNNNNTNNNNNNNVKEHDTSYGALPSQYSMILQNSFHHFDTSAELNNPSLYDTFFGRENNFFSSLIDIIHTASQCNQPRYQRKFELTSLATSEKPKQGEKEKTSSNE